MEIGAQAEARDRQRIGLVPHETDGKKTFAKDKNFVLIL